VFLNVSRECVDTDGRQQPCEPQAMPRGAPLCDTSCTATGSPNCRIACLVIDSSGHLVFAEPFRNQDNAGIVLCVIVDDDYDCNVAIGRSICRYFCWQTIRSVGAPLDRSRQTVSSSFCNCFFFHSYFVLFLLNTHVLYRLIFSIGKRRATLRRLLDRRQRSKSRLARV
jgi:hypothetical protein